MSFKRGTPEHQAYMKSLGAKGGRATRDKHPDHLKEIAAAGGRATKNKPKHKRPHWVAPPVVDLATLVNEPGKIEVSQEATGVVVKPAADILDVDAFLSSFQIAKPHA